jgi:tetratricopeptide (TPR) repeat protein
MTHHLKTPLIVLFLVLSSVFFYSSTATAEQGILKVPKSVAQQYKIGIKLFRDKKYEEAIDEFKYTRRYPDLKWQSELRMGICHFYLEEYRKAARLFNRIIYSKNNYEHDVIYTAYFYSGTILFFENRLDLAQSHLEEVRDSSRQPLIVKEAESLLKEIELFKKDPAYQLKKKYVVSAYASDQFGYDTNANITENGTGSLFNRVTGVLNIDTPQSWPVGGGIQYLAYNNLFLDSDVKSFDSLLHGPSLSGYYFMNADHSVRFKHKVGLNWFSTRSDNILSTFTTTYESQHTATWLATTETSWTGTMNLNYAKQNRDTTADLDSTGIIFGLGVDFSRSMSSTLPRFLNIGTKGTYNIYEGVQSEYYEFGLSGSYTHYFYEHWRGELLLNGKYAFYPKHPDQRSDTQYVATMSSIWSPTTWMDIGPNLVIENNNSNVSANKYFKFSLYLNVTLLHSIFI